MKRRKRKRLPPITTRTRPWGATKQAADAFSKIRELKNELGTMKRALADSAKRTATGTPPLHVSGNEIAALGKVLDLPARVFGASVGMPVDLVLLTSLHTKLEMWNRARLLAGLELIRAEDSER